MTGKKEISKQIQRGRKYELTNRNCMSNVCTGGDRMSKGCIGKNYCQKKEGTLCKRKTIYGIKLTTKFKQGGFHDTDALSTEKKPLEKLFFFRWREKEAPPKTLNKEEQALIVKKIKIGNSAGFRIPKKVLKAIKGDFFQLSYNPRSHSILLVSVPEEFPNWAFERLATMKQHTFLNEKDLAEASKLTTKH